MPRETKYVFKYYWCTVTHSWLCEEVPVVVAARNRTGSDEEGESAEDELSESARTDVKPLATKTSGERCWSRDTDITYASGTKVAGINKQRSAHIGKLISMTIESLLPRALMTVSAYPTKAERPEMFLNILVEQATALGRSEIVSRLLDDTIYAQHMMQIVCLFGYWQCWLTDESMI